MVELVGSVTDPHLLDFAVEVGSGAAPTGPTSWAALAQGNTSVVNTGLALWNTFGLTGPQTVRITARDRAGHTTELRRAYTLAPDGDLIEALAAVPALFSPNGDARRETTAARFTLALSLIHI